MHIDLLANIRPIQIKSADTDEDCAHACKKTGVINQAHFFVLDCQSRSSVWEIFLRHHATPKLNKVVKLLNTS